MSEPLFPVVQFLRQGFDPVPQLAELRTERPVSQLAIPGGPTTWLVTRYDDVRAVLGDAERFSNDFSHLAEAGGTAGQQDPGGLGFRDPPEHTRLRRFLTPEFTVRRLQRLVPRIEAIVAEHLDAMEQKGAPTDLVESFAMPIPSLVVCELLGVPYEEQADFQKLSVNRFDLSGDHEAALAAVNDSVAYLEKLVARERKNPSDGMLGMLIREHGDGIGDRELAGLADGMLTGGHDTTASMFAMGTVLLLQNPDHLALASQEETINQVVEEMLRYLTVVQVAFPRFAREDLVIGDQQIGAGDMVICSLSGANRDTVLGNDGAKSADLESFDPTRAVTSHVAFGHGIHHCVGAQLARMEMRIAFPALLRRFPTLHTAVPFDEVAFRPFSIVYGVQSLPVAW